MIPSEISNVSDFLSLFDALYSNPEDLFWFRGHADLSWKICPSALRYDKLDQRLRALRSLAEFRRLQEFRFPKTPHASEKFKWLQIAQHYGLPTRLLDWTQNPTIALYFACINLEKDGIVFALNPVDLNKLSLRNKRIDIVDPEEHTELISSYIALDGSERVRGHKTIAVKPAWNSDRIILQQGTFTLHGGTFCLDNSQAPSLVGITIPKKFKKKLLHQLERIGIAEMFIFPEPEHVCNHIKSKISVS